MDCIDFCLRPHLPLQGPLIVQDRRLFFYSPTSYVTTAVAWVPSSARKRKASCCRGPRVGAMGLPSGQLSGATSVKCKVPSELARTSPYWPSGSAPGGPAASVTDCLAGKPEAKM